MTKVFIGGSRHMSHLNAQIMERLDNIIEKGFPVLIGDANGADKAVQQYFHSKHYENVEVFCVNELCRNNVGNWETRKIPSEMRNKNAQFYSVKDRIMSQEATIGLMMWDGKSIGTLLNVFRLIKLNKKVVVYIGPMKKFLEFKNSSEWEDFITNCDDGLRCKVERRAKLETLLINPPLQTSFLR